MLSDSVTAVRDVTAVLPAQPIAHHVRPFLAEGSAFCESHIRSRCAWRFGDTEVTGARADSWLRSPSGEDCARSRVHAPCKVDALECCRLPPRSTCWQPSMDQCMQAHAGGAPSASMAALRMWFSTFSKARSSGTGRAVCAEPQIPQAASPILETVPCVHAALDFRCSCRVGRDLHDKLV